MDILAKCGANDRVDPNECRTMLENSGVIRAFGLHATAVDAVANLLGMKASLLQEMSSNEQVLAESGARPRIIGRVDYTKHPLFAGLADENPRCKHAYERV